MYIVTPVFVCRCVLPVHAWASDNSHWARCSRQKGSLVWRFHFPSEWLTEWHWVMGWQECGRKVRVIGRWGWGIGLGFGELAGQGHHIHLWSMGSSFFVIVMLTILFLLLGRSQEGEVTSLFRQLWAGGWIGLGWLLSTPSDRGVAKHSIAVISPNQC